MGQDYYLYIGKVKKQYFSLPGKWVPLYFPETGEITPMPSIEGMTLEALSRPRGTSPLQELLSRAQNIAIIVDDWTRPTPVAEILEVLLPQLANHGFSREHITIVVALGTHEAMKREELEARVGRNVASSYKVLQHNAWQSDLVPVKLPGDGRVVKISPEVARADLRTG